jgi:hypothetical protein
MISEALESSHAKNVQNYKIVALDICPSRQLETVHVENNQALKWPGQSLFTK